MALLEVLLSSTLVIVIVVSVPEISPDILLLLIWLFILRQTILLCVWGFGYVEFATKPIRFVLNVIMLGVWMYKIFIVFFFKKNQLLL